MGSPQLVARQGDLEVTVTGPNWAEVSLGGRHLATYRPQAPPPLPDLSDQQRGFVSQAVAALCDFIALYGVNPFTALAAREMMTCWERSGGCVELAVQKSVELDDCARELRAAGAPLGGYGGSGPPRGR